MITSLIWSNQGVLTNRRLKAPVALSTKSKGQWTYPYNDVGGVPGYFEFCKALKDPEHEEHESYMEWSGGDDDSESFDANAVNWELMKYLRWSRDRYQNWGGVE